MNNNIKKINYSRWWKLVAVIGLLIGSGIVFIANSTPNNPINADIEIKVPGLVCPICANGINIYLKKEIKIKHVSFDINKQLVYVDFVERDGKIFYLKNKTIIELIKKAGYEVRYIKRLLILNPNRYNKP